MREIFIKSNTYSYVIIRDFYLAPYEEGLLIDDGLLLSEYKSLLSLADMHKIIISNEDYTYIKGKTNTGGGVNDGYSREEVDGLLETKLSINGTAASAYILSPGSTINLTGGVSGSGLFDGENDLNIETNVLGKGLANCFASLDSTSKVPKNQLPSLTKVDIGLNNVDNTSDLNKPISNSTQESLDTKVDKTLIHEQFYGLPPTPIIGEADAFDLPYGVYLIRSDTVLNTPPNTKITCLEVRKTHDEVSAEGEGSIQPSSVFEQGTVSESSSVGASYEASKYPNTEPLHGSRIRTINPIAITEFSTISISVGFDYCVLFYDEDIKYLGRSTFQTWSTENRLTYPKAKYIAVAIKKTGPTQPIVPADAEQAQLKITTLGHTSGGSKQLVAWGALAGDLHTCVNIAGAWRALVKNKYTVTYGC